MSAAPRPGWYPDPAGTPELYRWWDGGGWTEAISESPRAPSPPLFSPADPRERSASRRPSRLRTGVALLLCLALFLSATIGLGLVIWSDPPARERSAAPADAVRTPAGNGGWGVAGRLDERSRVATLGGASLTLPPNPYGLVADPEPGPALSAETFEADAPVHLGFDGWHSWTAAVLFGRLPDDGTGRGPEHLDERAQETVQQLSRGLFAGHATRLEQVAVADHAVDGNAGVVVTAEVHYAIPRLASRFDRMTVVVLTLDDGSLVAAVSSVPDDADPRLARLAADALASLRLH